ncbi:metal ion transporter [Mycolicibacterium canariasense]|uniref:Metal ion transporter n=1 Tax=Mycolicibacterium canariasense TaxID=228230 RepID=A0A117I939_MYCCR|nr:hypothetical protein [Mycolicibacterium canariasense]MCV7211895.1 hypothetical protein [Mycolicibacterium canariasense]GAS94217.1 metal ion transporter [Mycolicibacterium canariasense]
MATPKAVDAQADSSEPSAPPTGATAGSGTDREPDKAARHTTHRYTGPGRHREAA